MSKSSTNVDNNVFPPPPLPTPDLLSPAPSILGEVLGLFYPPFFLSSPSFIVVAWCICSCPEELLRPAPMWQKIIHRFVFPPIFFLSLSIVSIYPTILFLSLSIVFIIPPIYLFIYLSIVSIFPPIFFSYYLYPPFPSISFIPFFEGG